MNILLNGLAALKPRTGVGHHVAELVAHLREVGPEHRFTVFPGKLFSSVIRRAQGTPKPVAKGSAGQRRGWKAQLTEVAKVPAKAASGWHFAAFSRSWQFDLYHEPNFVPFPSRLPTVITIHDLSVLRYPQWHPADRVKLHQEQLAEAARRAAHIITVSQAVRQEVCDRLNIPSDRVTSIYNGIGEQFVPQSPERIAELRQRLDLPGQYFLAVGTIEPRKNLAMLMRAYGALPEELRRDCPLVLAGPWGWRADEERLAFAEVTGVRQLGYVADDDLPALYGGAVALLYPSHYEGFGMPPTEMLACGGAIVVSDIPVLREVGQDQAIYLPPTDRPAWTAVMERLLTEPDYANSFRGSQGGLAAFNWRIAAEQTLKVYQQVLGQSV